MSEPVVVTMTAPNADEALKIARALVKDRLAACAQVVPGLTSVYRWKGEVCEDPELMLVIKTVSALLPRVEARIKELHSYDVPEIIALSVAGGSQDYLGWLVEQASASPAEEG